MNHAAVVLMVAIAFQSLAAILALRIHWIYGRRGAWWLISAAILLMSVHQALSLYRVLALDHVDPRFGEAVGVSAAWVSLAVSVLMLSGVALISPVFRNMAAAEQLIRQERDRLRHVVEDTEVELEMAREIQHSLLPTRPMTCHSWEIAGQCTFVKDTGGDLYDYFPIADQSALVYIADVSGTGLAAAMVATQVRTYIRALVETGLTNPGEILDHLNNFLRRNAEGQLVTVFLVKVDPLAGCLEYASAGHPAWIIDADGRVDRLESLSRPLGLRQDTHANIVRVVSLPPDSVLLLATDGLYEATSPTQGIFGIERAAEVVNSSREESGRTTVDHLQRAVHAFAGNLLLDDVSAVVIKPVASAWRGAAGSRPLADLATPFSPMVCTSQTVLGEGIHGVSQKSM